MLTSLEPLLEGKRMVICAGSGGVGKTTTAAAVALGLAERGKEVAVVTIDPAKRLATALGMVMATAGLTGFAWVVYWRLTNQGPAFGWGSIMAALLLFSGTQLILLGLIGEYVGRMFLTVNQRPQSVIRAVFQNTEAQYRNT